MLLSRVWTDRVNRNYLYAFVKDLSFFGAVLVPFFTDWGHLTLFQVQLIQSWFSLWVFILEVPTGAVADKLGRKHSIALGSLIIALAALVYGSVPRFEIFLLAEFIFAVGFALTSGADQALLYDTLVEEGREGESKEVLGRANSFHLAGMMFAAPIGSFFASRFGINAPMLLSSIPYFLAALIGISIQEPQLRSTQDESTRYLAIVKRGFAAMKNNRVVRTLTIDSVLVSAAVYFITWFYQPLLSNLSFPLIYFGLVQAFYLAVQIFVSSHFALFERLLGKDSSYLRNSALLTTLAFTLVSLFPHYLTVFVFVVVAGGIGYTRSTYIAHLAHASINSRERATVISSIGMVRRLVLIILNPLIGYLATSSLSLALFLVGLIPLATLFIKKDPS